MSLQLVDDDRVLEAALSLLDQYDEDTARETLSTIGPELAGSSPCKKKRRTRGYNPNRAREAQNKELLALRAQALQMEKYLEALQEKLATTRGRQGMVGLWKKLAMHERQTRKSAEEESQRLRALVREYSEVLTHNVQELLPTVQGHTQMCWPWSPGPNLDPGPYRRMYALPIGPSDGYIFREMADSIDVVHRQVLHMYSSDSSPGEGFDTAYSSSTEQAHHRAFADKVLPFAVDAVGDAAWQFFAHSFRRPTTRFYYHPDSQQSADLVSDDTVVEIFGEEHRFGQVLLDIRIKQIVRRYVAADRVVVAWMAILSPEKFKTETLRNIVYEEKGALVIEPCSPGHLSSTDEAASVIRTWQMVTPNFSENAPRLQGELVKELTEFVLNSCRPGRAVQSMERTLRAQPVNS